MKLLNHLKEHDTAQLLKPWTSTPVQPIGTPCLDIAKVRDVIPVGDPVFLTIFLILGCFQLQGPAVEKSAALVRPGSSALLLAK